jgi:hypothetical protein
MKNHHVQSEDHLLVGFIQPDLITGADFFGFVFFVFQSGALFLAICYILVLIV